jgi:hypothetical protein
MFDRDHYGATIVVELPVNPALSQHPYRVLILSDYNKISN